MKKFTVDAQYYSDYKEKTLRGLKNSKLEEPY